MLGGLVAPAMSGVANLRSNPFRVVAPLPGSVVRMCQAVGDGCVHGSDEFDIEPPVDPSRRFKRYLVGSLDVYRPSLFFFGDGPGDKVQNKLGFFFGEGASFDGVGPEDAAGDDVTLQAVRHLRERRAMETLVCVEDARVRDLQVVGVQANSECERTRAPCFDSVFKLGKA